MHQYYHPHNRHKRALHFNPIASRASIGDCWLAHAAAWQDVTIAQDLRAITRQR
jgi:hypothetical protein